MRQVRAKVLQVLEVRGVLVLQVLPVLVLRVLPVLLVLKLRSQLKGVEAAGVGIAVAARRAGRLARPWRPSRPQRSRGVKAGAAVDGRRCRPGAAAASRVSGIADFPSRQMRWPTSRAATTPTTCRPEC